MKKYIIKSVSRATDKNLNFKGDVQTWYHGKGQKTLGAYFCENGEFKVHQPMIPAFIEEYGYDRLCDARRSWTFNNPENTEFWETEVEIVEYETR